MKSMVRALVLTASAVWIPSIAQCQLASLAGVIDLHAHAAPDSRAPRSVTVIEAARLAQGAGMRALLIKNHYAETASQAYLVSQEVPGIEVYGGITLNRSVGGINVAAVENMARITGGLGRVVWLPTFDSEHNAPTGDNVPVTRSGRVLPEVEQLLAAMAEHGLALATGHVSPQEVLVIIRAAVDAGIDRIVVTHPATDLVGMSVEEQREAARLGALLEYTLLSVVNSDSVESFVAQIRQVGPDNVVLTTDLGQAGNPTHVEGLARELPRLREAGLTQAEIDVMTKRNPARFLGLD